MPFEENKPNNIPEEIGTPEEVNPAEQEAEPERDVYIEVKPDPEINNSTRQKADEEAIAREKVELNRMLQKQRDDEVMDFKTKLQGEISRLLLDSNYDIKAYAIIKDILNKEENLLKELNTSLAESPRKTSLGDSHEVINRKLQLIINLREQYTPVVNTEVENPKKGFKGILIDFFRKIAGK